MTKIKICGLFREEDIGYVNESLPDYVGFVFAESKRQVTDEQAAQLSARLDKRIIPVGVFVSEQIERIIALFEQGVIQVAQLHGDLSPAYLAELKASCPSRLGIPVIKAVPVDVPKEDGGIVAGLLGAPGADFLLFDYKQPGSGKTFDWTLLQNIKQPFFLAGGINTDNITGALGCNPYCIDISSGAETDGIKDGEKIRTLVQRAHTYQQRNED